MTASWLAYIVLVGAFIALAAHAIDEICRRAAIATRWVWLLGMATTALLATFPPERIVSSKAPVPLPVTESSLTVATIRSTDPTWLQRVQSVRSASSGLLSALMSATSKAVPKGSLMYFAIAWMALTAILLSIIVIVNRRVGRAKRSWPVGMLHGTAVRIAPDAGPAVVGLIKPDIVLPGWIFERQVEEQRIIIAHEREHIVAHDQLLPFAGWVMVALFPWHPAVWWMLSRLRLAIELDCDARVLHRASIQTRLYGALLIDIAERCSSSRIGALALADGPSHLERRLIAMKNNSERFAKIRMFTFGTVGLLAVAAACESRVPTSAEVEGMDVASAERMATRARLLDKIGAPTKYEIDGVVVTATRVGALPADSIASLQVFKTSNLVSVTTKERMASLEKQMKTELAGDRPEGLPRAARAAQPLRTMRDAGSIAPIFIIDGKVVSELQFGKVSDGEIESVEVVKGAAAGRYIADNLAKFAEVPANASPSNGIVIVKTKKGPK